MSPRHPFTPAVLVCAPAERGIYLLWDHDVLIFIGHAGGAHTILSRLMDHYCARAKPSRATHCSWELTEDAAWLAMLGRVGAPPEVNSSIYAEAD